MSAKSVQIGSLEITRETGKGTEQKMKRNLSPR